MKKLEGGKGLTGMAKSLEAIRVALIVNLNKRDAEGYEVIAVGSDYHFVLQKK